jgi:hypothetical protein
MVLIAFGSLGCDVRGRGNGAVLKSKDGQSEITLPAGWAPVQRESAVSQLMAANPATHEYVDLITESRVDMALALKEYATNQRDRIARNLNDGRGSELADTTVNGMPAERFELTGNTKKSGTKIGYLVTVVASKKNYHQLIAWTTLSRFEGQKAELASLAEGFRELGAEAPVKEK